MTIPALRRTLDRPEAGHARRKPPSISVALVIVSVIVTVFYAVASLARNSAMKSGVDLTIFDQAVRAYSHGLTPNVIVKTALPFNILGDHFSPILALLAPVYRLWPDARMLLVAQAILMGIGVFLVGRFATRALGIWGVGIAIAFAVSWGVLDATSFDFHEIAFAVPLLAVALDWLRRDRFRPMLIACGALLLVKEDSAFLVAGIALVLLARKKYALGFTLGAVSIAYFLLVITIVIPSFSFYHRYTYLDAVNSTAGLGGTLTRLFGASVSGQFLLYLFVLLLTAGLGVLSPLAFVALPTLLARLVSDNTAYTSLSNHYSATLMVVCFMALADAITRMNPLRSKRLAAILPAQATLLAIAAVVSLATSPTAGDFITAGASCQRCQDAQTLLDEIPDGTRVIADTYLMPQIVDRTYVTEATPDWTDSTGTELFGQWIILDLERPPEGGEASNWERLLRDNLTADGGDYVQIRELDGFALLQSVRWR